MFGGKAVVYARQIFERGVSNFWLKLNLFFDLTNFSNDIQNDNLDLNILSKKDKICLHQQKTIA